MTARPFLALTACLAVAAGTVAATTPAPEPALIDRVVATSSLTTASPTVAPASAPKSDISLRRASFTAGKTPPPVKPKPKPEREPKPAPVEPKLELAPMKAEPAPVVKKSQVRTAPPTDKMPSPVTTTAPAKETKPARETLAPLPSTAANRPKSGAFAVAEAEKYLGVPYVWGGTNPAVGLDCSGLVQLVYKNLGVSLPRVARAQAKVGTAVSLAEAKPGDLIGMRHGAHIAVYLGDGKILHAPHPGSSVSIRSLTRHDVIDTVRRVI